MLYTLVYSYNVAERKPNANWKAFAFSSRMFTFFKKVNHNLFANTLKILQVNHEFTRKIL